MNVPAAARTGVGVVDLSDRQRLRLTGPQAAWFLDQLVTQKVDDLPEGEGAEALLLTPQGKIRSMMRLARSPEAIWLDAEPLSTLDLHDFFTGRVFATKVEITDVGSEFGMWGFRGPRSAEAIAGVTGMAAEALPLTEHQAISSGDVVVIRVTKPVEGFDVIGPVETMDPRPAGVVGMDPHGYAALKSYEGVPTFGVDIDDSYLPQEAAMERMVHFKKGCYLGQEAVAMTQRGRIRRRLRRLRFAGDPSVGEVFFEDAPVGFVSSFGMDPDALGIATVATSVPLGAEVAIGPGSTTATVEELPHTFHGPAVPSARELRERLQGGPAR